METRKRVVTVQVDYQCPKCNEGYLRPTGQVYTSYPPQYPHKCNNPNCDYRETFMDKAYPHLDYEEIDSSKPVLDQTFETNDGFVRIREIDQSKVIHVDPLMIKEDQSEPSNANRENK